jgi:hypothetical protein
MEGEAWVSSVENALGLAFERPQHWKVDSDPMARLLYLIISPHRTHFTYLFYIYSWMVLCVVLDGVGQIYAVLSSILFSILLPSPQRQSPPPPIFHFYYTSVCAFC